MKKGRILNKRLNQAIADMGHGDLLVVCDAGFPIPGDEKRVDLAIEADKPGIAEVLDLVIGDLIYERCIVAAEQKQFNPPLYSRIEGMIDRCPVETLPYDEFMKLAKTGAKYVVRTGAMDPWGNVILCSGIDAPFWFRKPGVITPDFYRERASYQEKRPG
ncbi:MAG: D-ribose pyranase [Planctomycetota bacterium]|jgi:D-ribose pyranose/furanose isomerase RbsD|nr:D-ribose pyranase [Planctomycetota bacterium]